jgi:putative peptidoglycan lipid II flippase
VLFKFVATIGGLTAISRVLGFMRDILMTAFLGAGWVADCFVIAFKLPNFFRRLFAEGAFNAAFVPLFSEKLETDEDASSEGPLPVEAKTFAEETFSVLLLVLFAFVGLVEIFMPWVMLVLANGFSDQPDKFALAVTLTRITFPYLMLISLVSLLGGILNSLQRFAAVAATPILLNLAIIGALLGLHPYLPTAGHALSIGVTLGGLLQFMWLAVALRRGGISLRLRRPRLTPGVKKLLLLMAPVALGAGAMQVNLLIDIVIASFLPEGSLSFLFYADRLNQLPIGIVGVAIGTAVLPMLSRQISAGQEGPALHALNRGIEIGLFFALPAAVALMVVPGPLISALFERGAFDATDTIKTASALAAYALGLPAYVLIKVLSPAFFARQDTKTPVRYSIIALVLNTVLNLVLMGPLAHVGLALATAIAAWVNVGLLAYGLRARGYMQLDARLGQRLPRLCLAAGLMGLCLWAVADSLSSWFVQGEVMRGMAVAMLVVGGALVFAISAQLVGALRLAELKPLLRGGGEVS